MAALRTCTLALAVFLVCGCVMDHRTTLERPDFLQKKIAPQSDLVRMYTASNMGMKLSEMTAFGLPVDRCLNDIEAGVECSQGVVALKKVLGENVFGNLFGGVNSFRSVDDVVQDLTGNIDSFLLVTIRYKQLEVKTLTIFYLIYTRQKKETKGYNAEYRYLFRNNTLIYKDRGDSTKGPINSTEQDRKWGIDPAVLFESLRLLK